MIVKREKDDEELPESHYLSIEIDESAIKQDYETFGTSCSQQLDIFDLNYQTSHKNASKKKKSKESRTSEKDLPPCSYCGKICRTAQLLNSHEKTHQNKPRDKKYQCDLCGKKFALRIYIFSHMINIHSVNKR